MTLVPRSRRTAAWWLTLGLVYCATPARSQDLAVSAVRFWSLGDVTRVAIEVSGEFQHRYERLGNPDRIFFDFPGAVNRVSTKSLFVIPVGDAILRQIRVAEPKAGSTRVVLDLAGAGMQFTASHLANPDRLMVELRAGAAPPARPVAEPERPPVVSEARAPAKPFTPPPSVASAPAPALITPPPQQRTARQQPGESAAPVVAREVTAMSLTPPPSAKATPPAAAPATAAPSAPATPAPAKRAASGASTLTRALGLKVGRVVIDAGHGGHDTGSIGPTGLVEKDLVLDVSKRLGALVEKNLGSQVIYTRNDDSFVALETRTELANRSKADLFLSIHANSSPMRSVSGSETYYLSFTTSRTALDLAARENASSERSVFELRELVQKIALKEKVDESREFAAKVQSAMQAVNQRAPRTKDRGVKKAPFVVLIGASMPSVLTEIGFVSNAREETLLKQPDHRQKIAEALYKAVSQYAQALSHFEVAQRGAGEE